MTIIDASVLLVGALFGFYGLCSAVEYGVVIKMLAKDRPSRRTFTPLWELTNVWLVFGFTALVFLFNNALTVLSQALMATIIVAWGVMLARACLVIWLFYVRDEDEMPSWLVWLFSISTFAVPLVFSSAGVYLLSGKLFWQSWLGAALMLAAVCGFAGAGLLIVTRRDGGRPRQVARVVFALWLACLGSLVPQAAINTPTTLARGPLASIVILCLAGALLVIGAKFTKKFLWLYAASMCLAVPVLLAWANRPYLIAGRLSLDQAFGAQSYARVVVIGLAVVTPLILAGLVLFARLYGALPGSSAKP